MDAWKLDPDTPSLDGVCMYLGNGDGRDLRLEVSAVCGPGFGDRPVSEFNGPSTAFLVLFMWDESPSGHDRWDDVHKRLPATWIDPLEFWLGLI